MPSGGPAIAHVRNQAPLAACCLVMVVCLLSSTSCSFPGAVRPTLKIGLVAPFEGRYRAVGYDVIYAARLALQEVNRTGGVGGYAVELVAYDDGAEVAMAVEQAHKLIVDPDVLVAVGHFREETTRASAEAYGRAGLPLVAPTVLDPYSNRDQEAVFCLGPSPDLLADALIERALGLLEAAPEASRLDREILLVDQGGPLGASLRDLAHKREASEPGWRFAEISVESSDWRVGILSHNPLVLLCDLDPVAAGEVVSMLRGAGWSGHVLGGPELAASDFVAVAGDSARGASFITPWPFPQDVSGGEQFAAAYREVSHGSEPGALAMPAYEATRVVLEALERVTVGGKPSRKQVSAALPVVQREGLLGHIALQENQDWPSESLYWYHIGPEGVPSL